MEGQIFSSCNVETKAKIKQSVNIVCRGVIAKGREVKRETKMISVFINAQTTLQLH